MIETSWLKKKDHSLLNKYIELDRKISIGSKLMYPLWLNFQDEIIDIVSCSSDIWSSLMFHRLFIIQRSIIYNLKVSIILLNF